jgi:hypothetical protein
VDVAEEELDVRSRCDRSLDRGGGTHARRQTLVHEMGRREDAQFGLATMCIGVGQGIAMVVEKVG